MTEDKMMLRLADGDSLTFLATQRLGRLVTVIAGEPYIFPVNFALRTDSDGLGTLYIRTAPGDKLFAATVTKTAVFEVDEITETGATSVIGRGSTRVVNDADELELVDRTGLKPWIATWKPAVIAVDLTKISGRRFIFGDEPESGEPETTG